MTYKKEFSYRTTDPMPMRYVGTATTLTRHRLRDSGNRICGSSEPERDVIAEDVLLPDRELWCADSPD
jgi:hypothetical protein